MPKRRTIPMADSGGPMSTEEVWKLFSGGGPMFTAKEVCDALGVPRGTLNSWAHAGYFGGFDLPATIQGKARRFTWNDLLRVSILKLLMDHGFLATTAHRLALSTVDYMHLYGASKVRVVRYPHAFRTHFWDDDKTEPDALLEFAIFPQAIAAEMRRRLNLPSVPQVVPQI